MKDCCSHGSLGGLTAPYTCQHFHNSWQVGMAFFTSLPIVLESFMLSDCYAMVPSVNFLAKKKLKMLVDYFDPKSATDLDGSSCEKRLGCGCC